MNEFTRWKALRAEGTGDLRGQDRIARPCYPNGALFDCPARSAFQRVNSFTRLDFDGSYRLCWDSHNLYLHVQVSDPTPMRNTEQGDGLWNGGSRNSGDRTDWGVATLLK